MIFQTDDIHIEALKPLLPPAILIEELPLSEEASELVAHSRKTIENIITGKDDRLVVVVGPCSIHDPEAGIEYAKKLRQFADTCREELFIVMRVYFEKPRTRTGWKGLINDPFIDNSFQINTGLRLARKFLVDITNLGLPAGSEFLDVVSPQFIADCISWGAIGARTTESQIHRELSSGLSMPVGFKNGTDGNTKIAIDAIHAAMLPHHFLSITKQGVAAIVHTTGNPFCHVILRGSTKGPNYDEAFIKETEKAIKESGLVDKIMVDCSHGNSLKDPKNQPKVVEEIARQIESGSDSIFGLMMESHLKEGNQKEGPHAGLEYGKSITDACMSWENTVPVLNRLAEAVRKRRKR
ncbi:MAG: 3-deoxy-7-phosphoheptulonate synthase [Leptospira sp.]|nr:3-deoxy-7-phosphoheptulonate synthase [Leptospira sp.]